VLVRRGPAWVCGFALEPGMQYGSTAFAKPIRLFFRALVRPERDVIAEPGELPYVPRRVTYEARLHPVYERSLYVPVLQGLILSAQRLRRIQGGSLRMYLGYIFATLVLLLLVAR
jgi:hydrogenase-4 component B